MKYALNLHKLSLKGFKGFKELTTISFDSQLTVFIGDNGAGKSAILEAIAQHLMYLRHEITGRILYEFPVPLNPKKRKNYDVNNESELLESSLLIRFTWPPLDKEEQANIGFVELVLRAKKNIPTDFEDFGVDEGLSEDEEKKQREEQSQTLNQFVFRIKNDKLGQELTNTPVLVYYGCNSITTDINEEEEELLQLDMFDTYRQSLEAKEFNFKQLTLLLDRQQKIRLQNPKNGNGFLTYLEKAITTMLSDDNTSIYKNLHIEWGVRFDETVIDKINTNGHIEKLVVNQLSSGEKTLLALVADLTRRLYLANKVGNPLEGMGVVLIDEIDLHLHPHWQNKVVTKLIHIFPKIQFILTTHSPEVVKGLDRKHLRKIENGKISPVPYIKGRDTNAILEEVFDQPKRLPEYEEKLKELYRLMETDKIAAEKLLSELKKDWGETDEEVMKAESYLEIF